MGQKLRDFWKHNWIYLAVLLFIFVFCHFVACFSLVNGPSMENTLQDRDFVIVWQLGYTPKAGDVVVTDKENDFDVNLVKRVVATEGQTVEIQQGKLFIDGKVKQEDYLKEGNWYGDMPPIVVPENSVFLMGDNRNHSSDSREIGCFSNDALLGKVVFRVFPFQRIGAIH
ncbi:MULTISPECIES: signal peptidase I [Clostridiaceae]|uniref:Signal peptidase I n=1 Tax=Clostridium facile TaxID=2763035 RepID=A0ABR7ISN3_9CLOT|nr:MULTISPECIES: signal peptidase I [Clostridiaceae]MBC5788137.1 signal peptidase I [Clostridium facile]